MPGELPEKRNAQLSEKRMIMPSITKSAFLSQAKLISNSSGSRVQQKRVVREFSKVLPNALNINERALRRQCAREKFIAQTDVVISEVAICEFLFVLWTLIDRSTRRAGYLQMKKRDKRPPDSLHESAELKRESWKTVEISWFWKEKYAAFSGRCKKPKLILKLESKAHGNEFRKDKWEYLR